MEHKGDEETVEIDGVPIPMMSTTFKGCGYLTVEVGTDGYTGGNSTITALVLRPSGSFYCRRSIKDEEDEVHEGDSIEILLHGDEELTLLISALGFAVESLKTLCKARRKKEVLRARLEKQMLEVSPEYAAWREQQERERLQEVDNVLSRWGQRVERDDREVQEVDAK